MAGRASGLWCGAGMVVCLERGADLYMAQLMPLPLTVSGFSKVQIGFTFLVPARSVVPDKGPLNGYICGCWSREYSILNRERKCDGTVGTVLVLWAGHFQR